MAVILNHIVVPDTGVTLIDGTIVTLARFPGVKWVLHYGWYTYCDQQSMGWYFCSIPAQNIVPVNDEDLRLLTVVPSNGNPSCPGGVHPHPPGHGPGPGKSVPFTPDNAYELERAWLTVDTIAQRNLLNRRLLTHGKIVRVNETGEGEKYYIWNQIYNRWDDLSFCDLRPYLTKAEASATFATIKYVDKSLSEADITDKVEKVVSSSESIKKEITSIAEGVCFAAIKKKVDPIAETVEDLGNDVKQLKSDMSWKTL